MSAVAVSGYLGTESLPCEERGRRVAEYVNESAIGRASPFKLRPSQPRSRRSLSPSDIARGNCDCDGPSARARPPKSLYRKNTALWSYSVPSKVQRLQMTHRHATRPRSTCVAVVALAAVAALPSLLVIAVFHFPPSQSEKDGEIHTRIAWFAISPLSVSQSSTFLSHDEMDGSLFLHLLLVARARMKFKEILVPDADTIA